MFVEVDGKPIRASKQSAQWCLDAVDVCWKQKVKQIRERGAGRGRRRTTSAKEAYRKILSESMAE